MMDLIRDPTDPDTMSERNRRAELEWRWKRRSGFMALDPLTLRERADASYVYAVKRLEICRWLRRERLMRRRLKSYGMPFLRVVK